MTKRNLILGYCVAMCFCFPSVFSQTGNLVYSPVLVTCPESVASGFYFCRGGNTYFVTAGHVVFTNLTSLRDSSLTLTSYSPTRSGSSQIAIIDLNLARAKTLKELKVDKIHDVAVVLIARDTMVNGVERSSCLSYAHVRAMPDTGLMWTTAVTLFESVALSSDVYVFGYPRAIGDPDIPQLDYSQPLIRKGIVAGKNLAKKTLIIDCQVHPGNSGGPVFEMDDRPEGRSMRLIGLVSEFIPFKETWVNTPFRYENHLISNSGYGVVVPMDFVIDLTK